MYTVVAQREVPAPVAEVWTSLTEPGRLTRWLGDVDRLAPGETFRLEFGDGDFHDGRVVAWEPGISLDWRWSFLGLGPDYEIRWSLLPRRKGTEVSIQDRGALTLPEAECLRVGWSEFLMRLEKVLLQGGSARFRWRKMITFTARIEEDRPGVAAALSDPDWYAAGFPGVRADIHRNGGGEVRAAVTRDGWQGAMTRLRIAFEQVREGDYLYVTHEGWGALPSACAADERRRFVPLWREALARLPVS